MSDLDSAESMVEYYSERPPRLGSHTMIVRFSNYEELKTEPSPQVYLRVSLGCFHLTCFHVHWTLAITRLGITQIRL